MTTQAGKRTQVPLLPVNPEGNMTGNMAAFGRSRFSRPESLFTPCAQQSSKSRMLFLGEMPLLLPLFLEARRRKSPTYFKMHLIFQIFVDSSQQRKKLWHTEDRLYYVMHVADN